MADTPEEIQKHLKLYWIVGITLLVFTVITVAVALLTPGVPIGLGIATFKAGLVAAIFMHLNAEKSMIYKILVYTVFFFLGLMFLTVLHLYDPIISGFNR